MNKQCGRDRCLEMVENGELDRDALILMFVKWSTADDIEEMLDANEISLFPGGRWVDVNLDDDEDDDDEEDSSDDV